MMKSQSLINFDELLEDNDGISLFSGTIYGFFGKLFEKGGLKK